MTEAQYLEAVLNNLAEEVHCFELKHVDHCFEGKKFITHDLDRLLSACRELVRGLDYYAKGRGANPDDVEVRWFGMISLHNTGGKHGRRSLVAAAKILEGQD